MEQSQQPILETLTGSFLLSTRQMPDPRFSEQVIYICSHGDDGAVGIAVNKPDPVLGLAEVLRSSNLAVPPGMDCALHIGGPVEPSSAFILYQAGYAADQQLQVSPTVFLSRSNQVLEDISNGKGPEKLLFAIGYAGWGPGQLEQELVSQGWLTIPGDDSVIFDLPDDEKWRQAASLYGIDITIYQDYIGNA